MAFIAPNFHPVIPEIFVLIMGCLAVLTAAFCKKNGGKIVYYIVQLALIGAFVLSVQHINQPTVTTFNGEFILDKVAVLLKLFIYVAAFMTFLYSRGYVTERKMPVAEFYILGLFSILGTMVLVSAANFLTLFLGLELMALPTYAMVALRRDSSICTEAAMKYFIIGAMATGMLLYGLSMLYGATKSLDISTVAQVISHTSHQQSLIYVFALVFVLAGLAFKLGAVPFHMWVPDVYDGAPTAVTLFIGTAPKIAALGLMYRLLADTMPDLHMQWEQILIVVSVLSMGLGNFAAIVQTSFKRMLAYSSIAHMGYMLLGILTGTAMGYGASLFYMVTYTIMTLGAFGMIVLMSQKGFEADKIEDFRGLNSRNPWLAFVMLLLMFSMAGIPPFVGFMAKVSVLEAVIGAGYIWLAVLAILFAIVGCFYYIRVIKTMYFEEPLITTAVKYPRDMQFAISINGIAVLVLGIVPGALFQLCQSAF